MMYTPKVTPFTIFLLPIQLLLLIPLTLVVALIVLLSYARDGLIWAVGRVKNAR